MLNPHYMHTRLKKKKKKEGKANAKAGSEALIKRCFWRSQTVIRWHSSGVVYQVQMHRLNAGGGKGEKGGERVDEDGEERQAMLRWNGKQEACATMLYVPGGGQKRKKSRRNDATCWQTEFMLRWQERRSAAWCHLSAETRQRTARQTVPHHQNHLFSWGNYIRQTKFVLGCNAVWSFTSFVVVSVSNDAEVLTLDLWAFTFTTVHKGPWTQSLGPKTPLGHSQTLPITASFACFDP